MEGMTGGVHHAQVRLRLEAELRHLAAHIFQPLPVLADDVVSEESYVWEPVTNPSNVHGPCVSVSRHGP